MNTKKLKQLVLDLAIHGKLVPQDPNDEPASELLKRIVETHGRASNKSKGKKSAISSDKIDEVPFEVPRGWVWTTIENAYIINPKNDSLDDTIAGFVPMSNVGDAFSNKFVYEERPWKMIKKGFTHFQNGDVAVAKISPCMENRKSVLFDNLPNGIGAGTTELNVFRSLIYPLYSLYFFKSEYFIARCTSTFLGTVGQQRVDKEVLLSMFIPLPPLSEQRRIVLEIEKWFGIIDQLESNEADLRKSIEQTKKKVLDLAIHGKLVPQDPDDEPASELLKRIVETHGRASNIGRASNKKSAISSEEIDEVPFEVPEGWEWCRLGEICSFLSRGKSPKYLDSDSGYPVYAQKCNLKDGGISIEQARFLDPSTLDKWPTEYRLKTGDVLVNSTGTGTVGRTRIFNEDCLGKYPFVLPDSHVSVIRTTKEIFPEFVFYAIFSEYGQTYFSENLAGSTNQKELYIGVISNTLIPLPPLSEQRRIVAKIEEVFGELDRIEEMIG